MIKNTKRRLAAILSLCLLFLLCAPTADAAVDYKNHYGPIGDETPYAIPAVTQVSADALSDVSFIEDAAVAFTEHRITIYNGMTVDFTSFVNAYPSAADVIWTVEDTSILEIDADGIGHGKTVGSTWITARIGTVETQAYVVVDVNPMVTSDVKYPYYLYVNHSFNCVTVYGLDENGEYTVPVRAFRCSTGWKTPLGEFKLQTHKRWNSLFGGYHGQWGNRIVACFLFHSVPYNAKNNTKLNVTMYNKLGTVCSGGCTRLHSISAKWIYDNCPIGTPIKIEYNDTTPGPLGLPEVIPLPNAKLGWDPTDPAENNPWLAGDPVIAGVRDLTVDVGGELDYFDGITGTDTLGYDITKRVRVITSADTAVPGVYWVEYTLTDASFETVHAFCRVTVGDGGASAAGGTE